MRYVFDESEIDWVSGHVAENQELELFRYAMTRRLAILLGSMYGLSEGDIAKIHIEVLERSEKGHQVIDINY